MLLKTRKSRIRLARENDVDSLIPEFWANEGLALLTENMVMGNLVRRDFSPVISRLGDTVHVSRPGTYTAKRKTNADSITLQDTTTTDVPVKLNQWIHVAFLIRDGEESMALKSLVDLHILPAMQANARFVDRCLYGRIGQFPTNISGGLGLLTSSNSKDYILDTRRIMNNNNCPEEGRNFVVTSNSETSLLKTDLFISAEKVGDMGAALRNAMIGRKLGFDFWMSQNASSISAGPVTVTGAINNGDLAVGTTSFTVDGLSAAIPVNSWITIAGDMTPMRVVSTVGGATPTTIVVDRPNRTAVVNDAVVTVYRPAVTAATTYAAGYAKEIAVTFSPNTDLNVGQLVSFGIVSPADPTINPVYTIVEVTATGITLDRPLDVALLSATNVNGGPIGEYNFAFRRDALALVSRPLVLPRAGLAQAAVATYNNMSMRAVITYDADRQGHKVVLDMLFGTALLDEDQGCVMLG